MNRNQYFGNLTILLEVMILGYINLNIERCRTLLQMLEKEVFFLKNRLSKVIK